MRANKDIADVKRENLPILNEGYKLSKNLLLAKERVEGQAIRVEGKNTRVDGH